MKSKNPKKQRDTRKILKMMFMDVYYLDFGDGFTSVCIKLNTLKCTFFGVSIIPQ